MEWAEGYSSEWQVAEVDRDTWEDCGLIANVRKVSIARSGADTVPLLETGTMTLDDSFEWKWCRIYMVVDAEKVPMATLLFERSSAHTEKGAVSTEARGRSVLQPAADVKMPRGAYAPAGTDGAAYVSRILGECTPAPISVDGSFTLVDDVVFDLGSSHLDAAWAVLDAANWCMQIDGRGTVHVMAMPSEPALELSEANAGLLIPGVDDDFSLIDIPNRYIAVYDGEVATAVNEASHAERGRWVDFMDTAPVLVDGETLEAYAQRKLAEKSTILRKYSYRREFWPDVYPFSVVRASFARNGIEGDLRVLAQNLTCGKGVVISEVSGMEVTL